MDQRPTPDELLALLAECYPLIKQEHAVSGYTVWNGVVQDVDMDVCDFCGVGDPIAWYDHAPECIVYRVGAIVGERE